MIDSVVRGHHVSKSIWTPFSGEVLDIGVENDNAHDHFSIGIHKASIILSHILCELLRTLYFFLRHGGSVTCKISGHRIYCWPGSSQHLYSVWKA